MSRGSRRSRGSRQRGYPGSLTGTGSAWLVTASGCDDAGTEGASVNWGGAAQSIAPGTTQTFQPVILPEAVVASNAAPRASECDILGLDSTIDITSTVNFGYYQVALMLYVSEFGKNGLWDIRDVLGDAAEAADDSLLHVTAHAFENQQAANNVGGPVSIQLRAVLPFAIRIGAGQSLCVTLSNSTNSAGAVLFTPFIRAKICHIN